MNVTNPIINKNDSTENEEVSIVENNDITRIDENNEKNIREIKLKIDYVDEIEANMMMMLRVTTTI
jgi:hypothetical protein